MTKNILFAVLGLGLLARQANAQIPAPHYDPIRFDVGLSGAWQNGTGKGGFGGSVEGKFALMDNINVGLRIDGVAMFGGSFDGASNVSIGIGVAESFLLKGEYLLGTGWARPFASFGLGVYNIAGEDESASGAGSASISQKAGEYFGIAPEIGFDFGHVRLCAVYNVILGASEEVSQTVAVGQPAKIDNRPLNYLTIELAIRFGGNKKAAPPPPPPNP
jgi:hypothetical protein